MKLDEILNTKKLPSWHDRSQDGFSIIDAEYSEGSDIVRVRFKRFRPDPEWTVSFSRNNEIKLTGEGSSFLILANVIEIIREFVKTRRPIAMSLSADLSEPSRVSLYRKLVAMLSREFPDYSHDIRKTFRSMVFDFKKNGGPEPIEKEYLGDPITGEEQPYRNRPLTGRQREELDRIYDELVAAGLTESSPWKNIPKFYHGTSSRYTDDIMKFGLRPQDNPDSAMRGNESTIKKNRFG